MAKIAILVENKYEDLELQYPRLRLKEAGHTVEMIGPRTDTTYVGKWGYPQKAEKTAAEAAARDYDLIVIPGGTSPDFMRRDGNMIRFVRDAAAIGIPMAAICHGPWMLCSTNVLRGRRCTSFFAIAHDVANAGGQWVDEECVVDGPVITARTPDDLPAFMQAILKIVGGEKATGAKGRPVAPGWVAESIVASK
jgi:protease I